MTRDQFRLYKLIYYRFMASQMTPAVYDTLAAEIQGDGLNLRFGGQKMKFNGFTVVYEEVLDDAQAEPDSPLPPLKEGMAASIGQVEAEQRFTQPPPRYTEASLEDQVSDVPCEKCGAMMVYKMGRYGKFLACPNFPQCRHTMALMKDIGVPCPECGGRLLERLSRKGKKFYGCEGYPQCQFVSWDLPVNDKCPLCGGRMVQKRGRKGEIYHLCVNEQCRNRVLVENPGDGEEAE